MTWKVFAGEHSDIFAALVRKRAVIDGHSEDPDGHLQCLRAHLHRGLGYLASESSNLGISGFMQRWLLNKRLDKTI